MGGALVTPRMFEQGPLGPRRPYGLRGDTTADRAIDWSRARALRREVVADAAGEPASHDGDGADTTGLGDEIAAALMRLGPEQHADASRLARYSSAARR